MSESKCVFCGVVFPWDHFKIQKDAACPSGNFFLYRDTVLVGHTARSPEQETSPLPDSASACQTCYESHKPEA